MTFVTHGIVGASVFAVLFGFGFWPIVLGFILGSLPDTLDWCLWWLSGRPWMRWLFPKELERWGITYGWFHHTTSGLIVSALLVAPLPHVLHDHFVHPPVLARKGEGDELDNVIVRVFGLELSAHDILWLGGELQQLYLAAFLFVLAASIH
jgi:hypothetical protein